MVVVRARKKPSTGTTSGSSTSGTGIKPGNTANLTSKFETNGSKNQQLGLVQVQEVRQH